MDLRKYKYINNTRNLPGYADSKDNKTNVGNQTSTTPDIGKGISSSLGFLSNAVNSLNTSDYTANNVVN